ncbi:BREX-1 system adenine-specific DNA-methyltransferase PglX [Cyanobium sp. CH-040]|uniref:BREX-1 system adenine-specific DNA-methyltransferase PglX n=1 Tax=Cyanobium sp. CH-040 TaxID=2823708 RepID=UPI0020CC6B30|nr:BREX-1 system adenine-specific DNA-methyltransferase PglX [Cyanobium sp. CH-040]MCP9927632.1 BREX-1 system adenine-specific DNA-methyltransferase PglX [Cyanobium sp. CH-040]
MPVNTAALKTFAPAMRRQLLEAVGRKLDLLLHSQTPDTLSTYAKQIAELREQEAENREQLLERVAYTWFNRLCALRYLDARGWHPFGCKVLMPAGDGETQPELLKLMLAGILPSELKSHTVEDRLCSLLDGQIPTAINGADPQAEVYRELVLASCRFYHQQLPDLFEELDDATELLLPDDVLTDASITAELKNSISDDDCQDVEILGWLYQFYISEKKDEVMARKKAVPSEDIPAVTQLFTPHWIVRYLVENSLGRLWLRSRPNSRLKEHMPYFVEDPDGQAPEDSLTVASPQDIKLLDPACGSGHMLTYAFDLLVKIYEEEGHAPSEISEQILSHNLFGLEICPRASQLANFALHCKAREQSRRAFRSPLKPQVMCLRNVVLTPDEVKGFTDATGTRFSQDELAQIHQFRENTQTFGSLIQPVLDGEKLAALKAKIGEQAPAEDLLAQTTYRKLRRVLSQSEMLSQRYQIAVLNPPYLSRLPSALKTFLESNFTHYKSDLFAAFIARAKAATDKRGLLGFMTPFVWMFISSHEKLRSLILEESTLTSLVQLEYSGFDGATVPICIFTIENLPRSTYSGGFIRLADFRGSQQQGPRVLEAIRNPECGWFYRASANDFRKIPSSPIAYWISDSVRDLFKNPPISSKYKCKEGVGTRNDDLFLKVFWEVGANSIGEEKRWILSDKAGEYRRWFMGMSYVMDWEDNGKRIKNYKNPDGSLRSRPQNLQFLFREGVSWGKIGSGISSFRFRPKGFCFNDAAPTAFGERLPELLAMLNSKLVRHLLTIRGSTLNLTTGVIDDLPILFDRLDESKCSALTQTSRLAICLSSDDWDNFETSWDFRDLPLLRFCDWEVESGLPGGAWKGRTLAESWANYRAYCNAAIRRMQELEIENNRFWIDAYGLQDELNPEVPEDEITLARADQRKDITAFLSYAIGCMMGRYSLDQPGLILADSHDSQAAQLAAYEEKVGRPLSEVQFKPDADAILPVLDDEWFEDDIVARTREFLEVTFPESTVTENLRFIEDSLGKDIRKYFCSEFYKDHLQTYKKRPIYWMVQSPKKGFACLIYLHRYTKDTLNQVLNNYFRPYLQKLEARLAQLGLDQLNDSLPTRERTTARKEAEKITKVLKECQAWEQDALLPLAQQRIELDLDDGVKVNYLKLQDVLAPIPGLAAKED